MFKNLDYSQWITVKESPAFCVRQCMYVPVVKSWQEPRIRIASQKTAWPVKESENHSYWIYLCVQISETNAVKPSPKDNRQSGVTATLCLRETPLLFLKRIPRWFGHPINMANSLILKWSEIQTYNSFAVLTDTSLVHVSIANQYCIYWLTPEFLLIIVSHFGCLTKETAISKCNGNVSVKTTFSLDQSWNLTIPR